MRRRRWVGVGAVLVVAATGSFVASARRSEDGAPLKPVDAYSAVIAATEDYPLVALGEFHQMQQWHDFMAELLRRPGFSDHVDDLVVEFGNALYQDVADRFILDLGAVPDAELAQIRRNTIGGGVLWDAPVYEDFFRNVRALNKGLAPDERLRVVLGDPDVDFSKVRNATAAAELDKGANRDAFYADVVEREVMAKRRRAVLIAGADHLRRDVHANSGASHPTVAEILSREQPGDLYITYPLPFGYDLGVRERSESELQGSTAPVLARLSGTWLAEHEVAHRELHRGSTFGDQVDAVLWFGPAETLTLSRADPELYRSGPYADELRRRSTVLSDHFGEEIDFIAAGLQLTTGEPQRL